MINQDDFAAALIAKLTSSELNSVDTYTTQAPSSGRANRLDPVSFLGNLKQKQDQTRQREQEIIAEQLNKQAEAQFPLPPPTMPAPPLFTDKGASTTVTNINGGEGLVEVLREINLTLIDIRDSIREYKQNLNCVQIKD